MDDSLAIDLLLETFSTNRYIREILLAERRLVLRRPRLANIFVPVSKTENGMTFADYADTGHSIFPRVDDKYY